jgi:tRNA 2-thiouridine synthesizing protein A
MQKHAESSNIESNRPISKTNKKSTLDLRDEQCPFTFIKTKLKLEQMDENELLEVIFSDERVAKDVAKSIQSEEYSAEIVRGRGYWKLVIAKPD